MKYKIGDRVYFEVVGPGVLLYSGFGTVCGAVEYDIQTYYKLKNLQFSSMSVELSVYHTAALEEEFVHLVYEKYIKRRACEY